MPGKGRPFVNGDPRAGRPLGVQNHAKKEARQLAHELVSNPDYVEALRQRLIDGKAGDLEKILWQYAYGEPPKYAPSPLDLPEPYNPLPGDQ
jgi:hypothetical protein